MNTLAFETIFQEAVYQVDPPLTIIIDCPWSELNEDQRLLLNKILKAIGRALEGVNIVQQSTFNLAVFPQKPSHVIAFMTPPKGLAPYEAIVSGGTSVVFSDALAILNKDDDAKRKLWNTLKTLFSS